MSLPGVCPTCGASAPLEFFMEDAAARQLLATALALWPEPLRAHVPRYLGFFAPAQKRIALPKLQRLLREFVELVQSGEVTRNRDTRAAPLAAWGEGLAEVVSMHEGGSLRLPLDGHNLLCEIVYRRVSTRAVQAEASVRPLHASHRPAPTSRAAPVAPEHRPAESRQEWEARRETGRQHIGSLLAAVKRRSESPSDVPSTSEESVHE
jgi:hypothetical protein